MLGKRDEAQMEEAMTDPHDATFHAESRYGSVRWCAIALGRSEDWLRRNANRLEAAGFPRPDPITGHRIKRDVDAWIERRRELSDSAPTHHKPKVNLDAL